MSESKHLYIDRSDHIHYQQKVLDRRTCGARAILTRQLVLDVATGALYGEAHADDSANNLCDFLVRAWHPKDGHYFRGVPNLLRVPAKVLDDETMARDLRYIASRAGVERIEPLPGGFAAGVHAVKQFDSALTACLRRDRPLRIDTAQRLSALVSYVAVPQAAIARDRWDAARPLDVAAIAAVDQMYGDDFWRSGAFEEVIPTTLLAANRAAPPTTAELLTKP